MFLVETLTFKNELSIFDMVAQPQIHFADNTMIGAGKIVHATPSDSLLTAPTPSG